MDPAGSVGMRMAFFRLYSVLEHETSRFVKGAPRIALKKEVSG